MSIQDHNQRVEETARDDGDRLAATEGGKKPCAMCEAPELSFLGRTHWNLCPVCSGEMTP